MSGSGPSDISNGPTHVSLRMVLGSELIPEVLEALPRWASVGKVLREEFDLVLKMLIARHGGRIRGARRPADLTPAQLKKLLRSPLENREASGFLACCVWADTQEALKHQGGPILRGLGRPVWDTAQVLQFNPIHWTREELEKASRVLTGALPQVRADQARLFAFVMANDSPDNTLKTSVPGRVPEPPSLADLPIPLSPQKGTDAPLKEAPPPAPVVETLTDQRVDRLRDVVLRVHEQIGIGPLRQAARDGEFFAKGSRRLDVNAFKKFVRDAGMFADHLAVGLVRGDLQAGALRTLQRIALEASQDPSLPPRARSAFQWAHKGFKAGDWEQINRSGEILAKLREESPHPLLEHAEVLIAFLSGDLERVLNALAAPPQVGSTPSPAPEPDLRAVAESHRARLAEYRAGFQSLYAALRAASASGPVPERLAEASSRLSETVQALASTPPDSFGTAAELGARLSALGTGVGESIQHLSELATSLERDAGQLVSTFSQRLGRSMPVDGSLGGISRLASALEAEVARCEASTSELLERIEALPLDVPVEVIPPPDPAMAVQAAIEQLQRFEAALQEALRARAAAAPVPPRESPHEPVPESPRVEPSGDALAFQTASPLPSLLATGLLGRLREEARRAPASEPVTFLPVDARSTEPLLVELAPAAPHAAAANAAARNLLVLWATVVKADAPMRPLAQCLEFLGEAMKVRGAVKGDSAAPLFDKVVTAMALHCASADRLEARGRRRLAGLLGSGNAQEVSRGLVACAEAASASPALARVCSELVALGFDAPLAEAISELSRSAPAAARWFLDGVAIAAALVGREKSAACRSAILRALGAEASDLESIEDFLDDAERQSRRGARPAVPLLKSSPPLVTDFIASMGSRFWERGRGGASASRLGVTVPKAAEQGLFLTPGSRHVEVPIRVRSGGDTAVGGISILVSRPARGDSPLSAAPVELHVPWLSDQNLEDTASVILACRLELDPQKTEQSSELRLALRASWFGGAHDEAYALPLRFEEKAPADTEISGYNGEPLDLHDEKTFRVSSSSVQSCFRKLRDRLRQGKAVRAVLFGRRRRGKSSICSSLERDGEVQKQFIVRHHVWNGTRMTTLSTAFSTLSELLVGALAQAGVDAPRLDVSDLSRAEEMSQRFLYWFDRLADAISEKRQVLLLLDEFQKWLAGLGSKQERLALLSALRHFNDRSGKLEVSFVLSGLQSLRGLVRESTDLANAVESFEVRELTLEEADAYLRERMPLELDGRTRRRLISLSGGNPYVLNRLGGGLLELLRSQRRSWCTVADVDALLQQDDSQTGRLAEFVRYMLHEDEDDGAATLRQLSVLRAVASLLHERADFDGYVRLTDVEAWLQRNGVEFEAGEPRHQLEELVRIGLIQDLEGGRHGLRGEWLCRQLAALDPGRVRLQPVTSRPDPDLVLGRYRKKRQLDKGGEAEIWLAENVQEGGHDVVLRLYPQGTVGLHSRIERERNILSRIHHPNVVGVLGASIDERHGGVVVLNYIHGHTLEHVLESRLAAASSLLPGGDLAAQVQLLKKIMGAVDACHAAGIVHKDLSSRNVMVTQELGVWEPTLIDFGLSGLDTQPVHGETTALGTPGYIAPEKIRGGRRTPAADIYSLGALFLRLLTGHDPRQGVGSAERVARLCEEVKVPPRLVALLQQMLSEDPELRPSASEVRGCLETALKPQSWREFWEQAATAFIDDRDDEAVELFGQAISVVPGGERRGGPYEELLGEAAEALERSSSPVSWDTRWLDRWTLLARTSPEPLASARRLPSILDSYRARFPREGAKLIHQLATALAQPPSSPALAPLLSAIARQELFREPEAATATFEALARYYAERLLEVGLLEDFGVACARHARVRLQQSLTAQLWLQRVRSLGQPTRGDYEQELHALMEARRKTGRLQALPEARQQEPVKVGTDERAHLVMSRLEEFDRRVRRLFPFIHRLERVVKDKYVKASRPTLLRQDNIARHLPQGREDPGNIIPCVLDGSFTAEGIPLRMNIVLPVGTTSSQLDAAINVLKEATDLFDFND